MNQAARTNPIGGEADVPGGLRVVLVGQTGLDQSLRREAGLELYRARTAFEAVGELGTPIGVDSPRDAVVIVAPGTVTQDEMVALTAALRRVEPDVCVVGLLESALARGLAPDPARYGLDAWVAPPISAGVLRLLVANRGLGAGTRSEAAPAQTASPVVESQAVMVTAPVAVPCVPVSTMVTTPKPVLQPVGDAGGQAAALPPDLGPLNAMLTGGDVVTACLSVLRARPGGRMSECAFVPGAAPEGVTGVPVVHKGHRFGMLTCGAACEAELKDAAAYLGAWLALREQQSQLRRAAFTDPLTGAWNRRYFDGFLAKALAEAKASRHDVSLLLFDIDDFKRYNDRFGHAAGDEILVGVVGLLKSVVRSSDRVCRLGGDEFAVVFHEPSGPRDPGSHHPASILELARRFQKAVSQARFRTLGEDARAELGVSGGLATFPWDGSDAEALLAHADRLLRESKALGKNVIQLGPGRDGSQGRGEPSPRA